MQDLCCVGHITLDEIITTQAVNHLPGGTSWYFSNAISKLPLQYTLITSLANTEYHFVKALESEGVAVQYFDSKHTIKFINSYTENQNHRTQKVTQKADSFTAAQLANIEATVVHLGPLVADDIPPELIPILALQSKVSLDVQGYLRDIQNEQVIPVKWQNKDDILPFVHYLKTNEQELEVLTGCKNIQEGAGMLAALGVKEVIITLGSLGSVILCKDEFYNIPAYGPTAIVDATGCGDTYMAGYLYKRIKGAGIQDAGEFAAAMSTLKISRSGAFAGTEEEVMIVIGAYK